MVLDEETKSSDKEILNQICNDFLQDSGIHGMNKLQTSGSAWWRRYKILQCSDCKLTVKIPTYLINLAFIVSASALIRSVKQTFFAYPTTTSIDVDVSNELDFPAVTFCNLSPYNKSRILLNEKLQSYYLSILSGLFFFKPQINWSDPYYKENGFFEPIERDLKTKLYDNTSMELSKVLLNCFFDNVLIPCEEYFTPVFTSTGPCFTFNKDGLIKTLMRGGGYNLLVQAFIDQSNYFYDLSGGSGLKVLVHEPGEMPDVFNEGLMVHPGTIAAISISKHKFEFLPEPYKAFKNGYCLDTQSQSFQNPINFLFVQVMNSTTLVISFVLLIFALKTNIWLSMSLPYVHNNKTIGKMCIDRCHLPCSYTRYESQISYAQYPSDFITSEVKRVMDPAITKDHMRSNYILLRVFYEQLITMTTRQVPVYSSWGQILANLGGQMGLLLGASILTVSEIFEFVFFLIMFLCKKTLRRSHITGRRTVKRTSAHNVTPATISE
ncbi:hypothetical protein KUTeg_020845 [Tegillarca granosa]|uniref:Uncharacterized protein n=1 Tax=Tegillarca granosa TaxID=220873 RepID=A0ABQ9EF36_TEGGR|nr:hypothetical protein KUTeg_020845 [Tegillarca granosa]